MAPDTLVRVNNTTIMHGISEYTCMSDQNNSFFVIIVL